MVSKHLAAQLRSSFLTTHLTTSVLAALEVIYIVMQVVESNDKKS